MREPAGLVAHAGGALVGNAAMPGDKSISHRALILAALAEGESRLDGLSDAIDVGRTIAALRGFGADLCQADGAWHVRGGRWRAPAGTIDCGNAGTAARLLIGAAAGQQVRARFDGDASLRRRPMVPLRDALRGMGAHIAGDPRLPLTVLPAALSGTRFVNEAASAQVKAALLLAGLGATGRTEIIEPNPSRDHLELLLPSFGIPLDRARGRVSLTGPATPAGARIAIPGDMSAAAFPLIAALLVPGSAIMVRGVGINPLRSGLVDTLREMGADLELTPRGGIDPVGDIMVRASSLRGVVVPAERAPRMIDEYPVLAVAAACAQGETVMRGVGALRDKESDRIAALIEGLAVCGVAAWAEGDDLIVRGGRVSGGAMVASHGDHRIAMAFLVLGLVSEAPIGLDGAAMIATSFPGFADTMRRLGARIDAA